jgi:xylan 1,4-beta-xylosidase
MSQNQARHLDGHGPWSKNAFWLVLSVVAASSCGEGAETHDAAPPGGVVGGSGSSLPSAGAGNGGSGATSGGVSGAPAQPSSGGAGGSLPTAGGGSAPTPSTAGAGTSGAAQGGSGAAGGSASGGAATPTTPATCQGNFAPGALEGAPHAVTVNRETLRGQLPHFWKTYGIGHFAAFLQQESAWGDTLKAHVVDGIQNLGLNSIRAHGLFHDDLGIYREENGTPVYDFTQSDQVFDFLVERGVAPIVELASMPAALARDPSQVWSLWKMGISPPKDFQRWQELVYEFVAHSVQRYGADVVSSWYFEVWNEPECCGGQFWKGTIEEYFELYDHSVAGVLAALPGARVGGPVASQPVELTGNSEIGRKFLEHVTTDNYVKPGTPGQLDVLMYHTWNFIDGAVNGYFAGLSLLESFGLNQVGIAITEFGPTWQFNLHDEPQETAQGAAFVAQTYADIAQRCARDGKRFPITYAWWTLSDIFKEDTYREDEPFIGAMGLISRQNIRKPAYNAYRFLAQLGTEQVALTTNDSPGVGGLAARDAGGGVQVLIYNGQNPGNGPVDDTYYTATEAEDIAVTVSGLQPGLPYDVTAYRIDETHGNAYSTWQAMGRPTMTAMTEDDWADLRDTMDSKPEPMAHAQCGTTYSGRFSVASPGVLFVKLTPTAASPIAP